MSEIDITTLWAFLAAILAALLVLVAAQVTELTRQLIQAFKRKKTTGGKI